MKPDETLYEDVNLALKSALPIYWSQGRLGKLYGCTRNTIKTYIKDLQKAGYIIRIARPNKGRPLVNVADFCLSFERHNTLKNNN